MRSNGGGDSKVLDWRVGEEDVGSGESCAGEIMG